MPDEQTAHGFQIGGESDDLFKSAAEYHAGFRRPCPQPVVAHLVEQFGLDGRGRLLDVGCGTGQIFQTISRYFEETIAIDADEAMQNRGE